MAFSTRVTSWSGRDFQHDVITDYLAWQAKIVNEYKRPDQFITQDFSGGVHTNLDQWAIARSPGYRRHKPIFRNARAAEWPVNLAR